MGRARGSRSAEKRQAVLDAAAALVAERGHRASLAEICTLAGVSRQTIYNHYGDKSGLFEAVAALSVERCPNCPDRTGDPPETFLTRYAAVLLRWAYEPGRATALRARCRGLAPGTSRATGVRQPAIRRLADYLRQETADGRLGVQEPRLGATLFLDLVLAGPQLRIALGAAETPAPEELEALSRRCARLFVRGWAEAVPPPRDRFPFPRGQAPGLTPHAP